VVILSIVSAKGGVGKTTLAANLALALSKSSSVVALDLDPQNALRRHLSAATNDIDGVGRATLEGRPWSSALFGTAVPKLVSLPYGELNEPDRDAFEVHLSGHPQWLAQGLNGLGLASSDIVVIDTPPGPSLYQQQVLRVAHFVLVVVHADAASYATLSAMEGLIDRYCAGREGFLGSAYLLNSVNMGSALSRDVVRVVRLGLGDRVLPTVVHQDEAVREALAFDQLVMQYAPNSEAASDIGKVAGWLVPRLQSVMKAKTQGRRA
jgi:cellulose synthase operon protein YhjQ